MHVVIRLAIVVALIPLVLTGCGGASSDDSSSYGIIDWPSTPPGTIGSEVGDTAPNFRLKTPNGDSVELSSYAGKPVLIYFFSAHCDGCDDEMRALQTVYADGTQVLGLLEDDSAIDKMTEAAGATFTIVLDDKTEVGFQGFDVKDLPVTALIDANGTILDTVQGVADAARLQQLVERGNNGESTPTS